MADPLKTGAREMAALESLLDEVAAARPAPSPGFLERLVAEADAAQPVPVRASRPRPGFSGWLAAIGGWPAFGGLVAATLAGVWIGIAPPAAIDGYLTGSISVELLPETSVLLEEG